MVAALVRGHRRSIPTVAKHLTFAALPKSRREEVMNLLPLLRLADSLESAKRQDVNIDSITVREQRVDMAISFAKGGVDLDELLRKSAMFEGNTAASWRSKSVNTGTAPCYVPRHERFGH